MTVTLGMEGWNMFANVSILNHATEVYTVELYHFFQEKYKKGTTCAQKKVQEADSCMLYKVWRDNVDEFSHLVTINWLTQEASCTGKKFEEI